MPWNNNENNLDKNKEDDQNLNIFDTDGSVFVDTSLDAIYSSSVDFDYELTEFNQSYFSPYTGSFSDTSFSTLDINLDYSESLDIDIDTTIFISQPNSESLLGESSLTNIL